MKYFFILLVAMVFLANSAHGQQENVPTIEDEYADVEPYRLWLIEPSFSVSVPQGNFSTKLDGDAFWGLGLATMYQLAADKPAFIGADIRYNCLQTEESNWLDILDTGQLADFSGSATSNMVTLDLVYRYFPSIGLWGIEPYVEGRFGTRWMYTFQSTSAFIGDFEEFSEADFVNSNWALSYGGSIGFQVHLSGTNYLNIKTVYTLGNSTEIDVLDSEVDPADITFPIQAFRLTNTATSTLRFEAGVTLLF